MLTVKCKVKMQKGFTIGELLVASSIAILVIGGAFALWFMTQDTWTNERIKSEILQELQVSIERIKREITVSDGSKMFFHTGASGTYDAISLPIALDDGRSDTGYSSSENGDGFIEHDSTTIDPVTGVAKIWWDKTIIYHIYTTGGKDELRRTVFYPRNNSLTTTQRQDQIDKVVSLGTGNDSTVPNYSNCQNLPKGYRTIFTASSISFEIASKVREFDGYSSATEKTEKLIDFGSAILAGGYHTIKFKVTNKGGGDGYAFGVDSLKFTPPGSVREAENYKNLTHPDGSSGISDSSADTITNVNMHNSPYGLWSADYYLDYAANAVNDYLTLRFHYDRWYETTFLEGMSDNLELEFSNTDGKGGTSGNKEWLFRLEGNEKTWDPATQTQAAAPATLEFSDGGVEDITYRNIIMANYTTANGMMLSIKFRAGNTYPLEITSAHIIQRDESETGSPDDGSTNMPSISITFTNCHLDPRNQGQTDHLGQPILPPTTTTGSDVTIPAEAYAWSNWVQLYDNSVVNFNFDKTQDYFISIYIPDIDPLAGGTPKSIAYWQDTTSKTHSYTRSGQYDHVSTWGGSGATDTSIYGIEEIDVTYVGYIPGTGKGLGSFSSQIFDTGVTAPVYSKMIWNSVDNNPDATLKIRVRTSDSKSALVSDGNWETITGTLFSSSPADLSGINKKRYIQFKAEFEAIASGYESSHITDDTDGDDKYPGTDTYAGDEDYDISCVLKDVSIYWPGNTTMVDVGGYFTKKSNYGIFTIEIDGQKLTKGIEIKLSIEEDLTTGAKASRSISAEVEPRNTNK